MICRSIFLSTSWDYPRRYLRPGFSDIQGEYTLVFPLDLRGVAVALAAAAAVGGADGGVGRGEQAHRAELLAAGLVAHQVVELIGHGAAPTLLVLERGQAVVEARCSRKSVASCVQLAVPAAGGGVAQRPEGNTFGHGGVAVGPHPAVVVEAEAAAHPEVT